ncbi:MAG: metal ABC transporter permease [bacterium]
MILDLFTETFMQHAFLAGMLITALCAYLGVFILYKRIVFVGVALAELSALGVVLGVSFGLDHHLSSLLFTMGGIIYFGFFQKESRVSRESVIGLIYALAAALTVLALSQNPGVEASGLDLVSGNLLFVSTHDIMTLVAAAIVIAVLHYLLFKEFVFVSFDRETAATLGLNTRLYELLLYFSFGLAISVSMKIAGVVFVFSSLIIPAMIGLSLSSKNRWIFTIAVLSGLFSCFWGIFVSFQGDLPTGPTVVAVLGILFLAAKMIKSVFRS